MTDEIQAGKTVLRRLQWECLDADFAYRATAPLFGTIRVERHSTEANWHVNWSVPGFSDRLLEGAWPSAESAMHAASTHVCEVFGLAPSVDTQLSPSALERTRERVLDGLDRYARFSEEERLRARMARIEGHLEQIASLAVHERGLSVSELESKLSKIFLLSEWIADIDLEEDVAFMEGERARTAQILADEPVV